MADKSHSVKGELFRMGVAATAGAAAAYGGRALLKQFPAIMASAAVGQVTKVADKVKDGVIEGASRVTGELGQNASEAVSASSATAKRAASGGASVGRRTASAAKTAGTGRRTSSAGKTSSASKTSGASKTGGASKTTSAGRRTRSNGSSGKGRAAKPA